MFELSKLPVCECALCNLLTKAYGKWSLFTNYVKKPGTLRTKSYKNNGTELARLNNGNVLRVMCLANAAA